MRKRYFNDQQDNPMGLFSDPVFGFAGLMVMVMFFLFISIKPTVRELRILPTEPPPCPAGLPYVFTIPVQGGFGDRTFSTPDEEALRDLGLVLNPKTGTVSGTVRADPARHRPGVTGALAAIGQTNPLTVAASASAYVVSMTSLSPKSRMIRFVVKDDAKKTAQAAFPFRVLASAYQVQPEDADVRLLAKGTTLPAARVGVPYEAGIGVRGGLGKVRWSTSKEPPGLSLLEGRLFGVPKAPGAFDLEVRGEFRERHAKVGDNVIEWQGGADRATYTLSVLAPLAARQKLPLARAGEPWSASLFSSPLLPGEKVVFDGLPAWLSYSEGVLTGTPGQPGTSTFRYKVHAGATECLSGTAEFRVLPQGPKPQAYPLRVVGRVGEPLRATIPYRGLVEPVALSCRSARPQGLDWSGTELRGTPAKAGDTTLAVTLTDALGTEVESNVVVRIRPAAEAFKIAVPKELDVTVGTPFSWRIPTTGGEALGTVQAEGALPPGCEVKEGILLGTVKEPGKWKVRLTAREPVTGEEAKHELLIRANWTVSDPLRVATASLPPVFVGDEYAVALAATGAAGQVTWSVEGELPGWLKLDGGILRGRATLEGKHTIKVLAEDSAGRTSEPRALELAVEKPERSKPAVVTVSLSRAFVGQPYSVDLAAEGGLGSYTWIVEGKLPPGFRVEKGRLKGTAAADGCGRWPLSVQVEDERRTKSAVQKLVLEIEDATPLRDLQVVTEKLPAALVGETYEVTLAATGGVGEVRWKAEGLPEGLTLEGNVIRGVPSKEGKRQVSLFASDRAGRQAARDAIGLAVVRRETSPPEVVTVALPGGAVGRVYTAYLAAERGLGRYRWKVEGKLPAGVSLVANRLEGTPAKGAAGKWPLTLSVQDERGAGSKGQAVTLEIEDPESPVPPPAENVERPGVGMTEALYLAASFAAGVLLTLAGTRAYRGRKRAGDDKVIHFRCQNSGCNHRLRIAAQHAGRSITCPVCKQPSLVPRASELPGA